MSARFAILVLSAAIWSSAPAEAQVYVPADQPTLQAAIDACPPNGTVIVTTTFDQDPVVIDKPLRIVGDPACNVSTGCPFGRAPSPIRLAGPGSGLVVLQNVNVNSGGADCPGYDAMVSGGGFSELHILDSSISAPFGGLTGYGTSGPGISISVPFLLLSGSSVSGGSDGIDTCPGGTFGPTPYLAYPAVVADQVLSLDSSVVGGRVLDLCCVGCSCPPDISTVVGSGGTGIQANHVWISGGSVAGGAGTRVFADGVQCGTGGSGQALSAARVDLPGGFLRGSGPLRIGTTWNLDWYAPGSASVLNFDLDAQAPVSAGSLGYSFMGGTFLTLFPLAPASAGNFGLPVPPNPVLIGFEVVFQIFDASEGWSRPVVAVVEP